MSRMPLRGAGPVGPSVGVHHWAALPSGVNVSGHEVNNAESGPSHANHQNENVPGTHTRPFRSQIGGMSVPAMVGGASPTRNQSSDECGAPDFGVLHSRPVCGYAPGEGSMLLNLQTCRPALIGVIEYRRLRIGVQCARPDRKSALPNDGDRGAVEPRKRAGRSARQ